MEINRLRWKFNSTGGAGNEANKFLKKFVLMIAEKTGEEYAEAFSELRIDISFSLQKSTIAALRGTRKWHLPSPNYRDN